MNILITSVGRRSYIVDYFKSALRGTGKVIVANSVYTNTMSRADSYSITPVIHDGGYVPFILDLCANERIRGILSLFDSDLPVLASSRDQLRAIGTRFIGPSPETARIGNDKLATAEHFRRHGIQAPTSVANLTEAENLIDRNLLSFPLVIKPRWGMGSLAVYIATNVEELVGLYLKCSHEIFRCHLANEARFDKNRAVIIQSFVAGQEYGLNIFKDLSGNFVDAVAVKKVAMRSGETDIGEVVDPAPFSEIIATVTQTLEFTGVLSIDCFLTDNGVYAIEINPRISGHYPFCHLAGVRYPDQVVSWLRGGATNPDFFRPKIGLQGCKELVPTVIQQHRPAIITAVAS